MSRLKSIALASLVALSWTTTAIAAPLDDAMAKGRDARRQADFAAAARAFDKATQIAPQNAEAWHMLGLMQAFQAQYDAALRALARAQALAPSDLDIALSVARVHGFAGNYREADQRVDAILAQQPNNVAAWTLKGRVATYRKDYKAARTAYDKAAALAAPDVDLLVAYGDLARAEGREDEALVYYKRAQGLDPQSADVKDRLVAPASAPAWTLTLGGGKSWLSRTPARDWTAYDATLAYDISAQTRLFGGLSYAKRFSQSDTMIRAGAAARLSNVWSASLEMGLTPKDDVLPEFQTFGTLSARLQPGTDTFGATVAVLDAQVRRYNTGSVKTLSPGLDQYFSDGAFVLSARIANTWDANDRHLTGWNATALWQITERFNMRVGYGNAPEAERGIVADTKSLTGGIGVKLTEAVGWRVDITRESRQGSYRRVELLTGLSLEF